MSNAQHVQHLLEELGPTTPEVGNVSQVAENIWAVGFDPQAIVLLQLDDSREELVVSCGVGRPLGLSREKVFESLLAYNALWRDTGGVRMAVADGEAIQIYSLPVAQLDVDGLRATLLALVDRSRVWRRYLETAEEAPRESFAPTAMRV
ncbi:MAG TPA: type III secretion system chaperone [Usitatibacter sp.]|nr:type III secretion system chaperone [Usitatibacter sp.]